MEWSDAVTCIEIPFGAMFALVLSGVRIPRETRGVHRAYTSEDDVSSFSKIPAAASETALAACKGDSVRRALSSLVATHQ